MDIDRVIDEIAARRHGLLPRAELRAAGIDRHAVDRRIRAARVEVLSPRVLRHRAVPRSDEQRVLAGCLDVTGEAVASFDTAAWLWRLPGLAMRRVEVTAKRSQHRGSRLAFVHHPRRHLEDHIVVVRGIEVTDLPWTIFNLASRHHPKRIARLIDSIGAKSPSVLVGLHKLLPRMVGKGMTGCVVMRELLEARPPGIRLPGSGAQRRFEEIIAAAGITGLRREVDLGGFEWTGRVDYKCDRSGVIFEIDSELHHTSPTDVAADAERDATLIADGATDVVRIWTEVLWSSPATAVDVVRRARSGDLSGMSTYRSRHQKEAG